MIKAKKSNIEVAAKLAASFAECSRPCSAHAHVIRGGRNSLLFIPNGSRLLRISNEVGDYLSSLISKSDQQSALFEMIAMGLDANPIVDHTPLHNPPLYALSLAIAQKCNMGCTYCYAAQGEFGSAPKNMPLETALKSIDLLLKDKQTADKVQLTFLGGEPLMNRKDIRLATAYAANEAAKKKVNIGFSITSNGTLMQEDDARFFEDYGFAVTISLDGLKEEHDKLRPLKNGKGSYSQIMQNIQPLLAIQKKMQVSVRVTVTPQNSDIAQALDEYIAMGFHSVGFSPLLRSINGQKEMNEQDLRNLLTGMIECGLKFEEAVLAGKRYPFLNMLNAFREISKSTHRPYPCGAGAGYFGVSADGQLAACHRFVNDKKGIMGSIEKGVDLLLQNTWLSERHVHNQQPCSGCWARYLCGGGCHHEVIEKGRLACDYIRGWLHYMLQSYERINRLVPGWNK